MESTADHRPSSRRAYFCAARCFLRWMVADGHLRRDPLEGMRPPTVPRTAPLVLSESQVGALLRAAPDARARLIVWLEVGLALRSIEVTRLNVEHWRRGAKTIRVVGKGGHQRELPVVPEVERALIAYLAECPADRGPLVRSVRGHRMGANTIIQMMSHLLWDAGVKSAAFDGIAGHSLRRTCATDVYQQCKDIRLVQTMLGHASLGTTQLYLAQAELPAMREAMEGRPYRSA